MLPLPPKPVFDPSAPNAYFVRAAKFYNSGLALGYSTPMAIGLMVAQPDMEAAFRSDVIGDKGEAFNAIQWHEPRITNILNGCGVNVKTTTNIPDVVKAIDWELNHTHTKARDKMLAEKTAGGVAEEAAIYYEGAGAANAPARRAEDAEWWTVFFYRNAGWVALQV